MSGSQAQRRFRMVVAYDGTGYAGWQRQAAGKTVQETLEQALASFGGSDVRVHACSRTDSGVHARGQVVHCDLPATAPGAVALGKALNALLPADIRVLTVHRVPSDFHARYAAREKEYRYFIWNGPLMPPEKRLYATWVRHPLDARAMQAAADRLTGKHDFAAFTANPNRPVESTVRTLRLLQVRRRGREVVIRARADGFLYRMVRSLAGFLLRVGEGAVEPSTASDILASTLRTARVPTAPPEGLFLWKVWY